MPHEFAVFRHSISALSHEYEVLFCQIHVAIVTAAGYPGEADRFEERVAGLLAAFKRRRLPSSVTKRSGVLPSIQDTNIRFS